MSDLDDEILGLVGGDSDDEGDDLDQLDSAQVSGERSPSQEAQQSVEKTEEPQANRRGVAQKVKSRGRRKRKQESEDEDDGAGSPSPAASLGSGAMQESEGEADAPGEMEEDAALFPVEGRFHSKADRDHIMSLPEIEREGILAERAEEVERRRQDLILKKALSQNASKQKRKAAAAELDEGNRRSTRPKTEKRTALDDYKRAREQKKGAENSRLEAERERRDERSPSSHSDRDADGESEVEWAEPSTSRRDEPPPELKDFQRCRVGRSNFAKVCFYPGFEDAIKGCFARVSIGINRETGQNQYRMAQIKGFTEGKPYQLEASNGKQFTTDQYALVAQGPHERPWPLHACSDGSFTESEYNRYVDTLQKESMRLPSRKFLLSKLDAIHALLNQNFTEETLQIKFAKQRAMEQKYDPIHIAKQKRKDITKRRYEAELSGDQEEVARCDSELEALDNAGSSMNGASKPKLPPAKPAHQDHMAKLNQNNRTRNAQEVRQALIAERKKRIKEHETAEKKKAAAARLSEKDLFGETPNGSRAGTPANGASTPKKSRAGTPQVTAPTRKGPIGALKQKHLDDEMIGSLDLGIDVEI